MPQRNHYDNLKVMRNAPPGVIRAAYRALAQQYHPDVNRSPDAERIMKVINEAYAVLSDPERRAEHDAWIADQLKTEPTDEAILEPRAEVRNARKNVTSIYGVLAVIAIGGFIVGWLYVIPATYDANSEAPAQLLHRSVWQELQGMLGRAGSPPQRNHADPPAQANQTLPPPREVPTASPLQDVQ